MDILNIDVGSFAARIGFLAATGLYGLLEREDASLDGTWIDGGNDPVEAEPVVLALADYVIQRSTILDPLKGETLFHYASSAGLAKGAWGECPPAKQMAFNLFASVTGDVHEQLRRDQKAAEDALEIATRPEPAPLKLEDSIYEPDGSLDEQRPEAAEAARMIADMDQARTNQEAAAQAEQADLEGVQEPPSSLPPGDPAPETVAHLAAGEQDLGTHFSMAGALAGQKDDDGDKLDCIACGRVFGFDEPYYPDANGWLCGNCAPTYAELLEDPVYFQDEQGKPMTIEARQALFDAHIAGGGSPTDSMASVSAPATPPADPAPLPPEAPTSPAPLSLGETAASQPVNKGGRGRKKKS